MNKKKQTAVCAKIFSAVLIIAIVIDSLYTMFNRWEEQQSIAALGTFVCLWLTCAVILIIVFHFRDRKHNERISNKLKNVCEQCKRLRRENELLLKKIENIEKTLDTQRDSKDSPENE